jgi:hypothetical protein
MRGGAGRRALRRAAGTAALGLPVLLLAAAAPAQAEPAHYGQSCYFDRGSLTLNARCRTLLAGALRVWQEERDWQAGPPPPRATPAPGEASRSDAPWPNRPWSGHPPRIRIIGHAQEQRSAATDEQTAWRRAEAVARALAGLGVPEALLLPEGRGARDAQAPEGGPQPANRRVDLRVVGGEPGAAPPPAAPPG